MSKETKIILFGVACLFGGYFLGIMVTLHNYNPQYKDELLEIQIKACEKLHKEFDKDITCKPVFVPVLPEK